MGCLGMAKEKLVISIVGLQKESETLISCGPVVCVKKQKEQRAREISVNNVK